MKAQFLLLIAILGFGSLTFAQNGKVKMDDQDKKAEHLINRLLDSLLIADFDQSAHAVAQLTHKSSLNSERDNLSRDLLDFSFKKAHDNAKFYAHPVKITRIQKTAVTAIGHSSNDTAEAGEERKYWIAKKPGVNGMPAPINVFFPADGGHPKINYMGSL
jgi:hypothetical protein